MINQQKKIVISQKSLDKKLIIYLYRLGFIGITIICAIVLLDKSVSNNLNIWLIILIILIFWLTFGIYLKKSAYKITINLDENEIRFFMMKNEKIIAKNISEIKEVRINLYITFYFDNKKVVYNDARNLKLIENLNKYFNVRFGIFGKILPKLGFKN